MLIMVALWLVLPLSFACNISSAIISTTNCTVGRTSIRTHAAAVNFQTAVQSLVYPVVPPLGFLFFSVRAQRASGPPVLS